MRQSASRPIVARKAKPPAEASPMTPAMGVAVRGHHTPHDHVVPRLHIVRWARWLPAVAIAIVAGAFYAIQISEPAFFDNEGRYAEVARQMVTTGDWITPRLNDTLFLNKPPLAFWLAAVSFETLGTARRGVPAGAGARSQRRISAASWRSATGPLREAPPPGPSSTRRATTCHLARSRARRIGREAY